MSTKDVMSSMGTGYLESYQRTRLWVHRDYKVAVQLNTKCASSAIKRTLFGSSHSEQRQSRRTDMKGIDWSQYLKLIVVRDPLDRVASCYQDKVARDPIKLPLLLDMGCFPWMPFDQFCEAVAITPDSALDKHLIPQHYLLDAPNWPGPDTVIPLENLTEEWGKLGLPPLLPGRRARFAKPVYNSYTTQLMIERYQEDIDRLSMLVVIPSSRENILMAR